MWWVWSVWPDLHSVRFTSLSSRSATHSRRPTCTMGKHAAAGGDSSGEVRSLYEVLCRYSARGSRGTGNFKAGLYVRWDAVCPSLTKSYSGPFKVLQRGPKVFRLQMETGKKSCLRTASSRIQGQRTSKLDYFYSRKYIKRVYVTYQHRIIDDRIEKSIKGRRIGHNLPVLPWHTLWPPPFPTPGQYILHSSLRQSYFEKKTMLDSYFAILSSIIRCVPYNSVNYEAKINAGAGQKWQLPLRAAP